MPEEASSPPIRWIVHGPDVTPERLARVLADPAVHLVHRVAPDDVVLSMTAACAERLKAAFPELIVEADRNLDPLG